MIDSIITTLVKNKNVIFWEKDNYRSIALAFVLTKLFENILFTWCEELPV